MNSIRICCVFSNIYRPFGHVVPVCNGTRNITSLSYQKKFTFPVFSTALYTTKHQHSTSPNSSNMSRGPHMFFGDEDHHSDIRKIFKSAVESVLPRRMIEDVLQLKGNILRVKGVDYELDNNLYMVGFGKAVLGMARAAEDLLHSHIVKGIVSVPYQSQKFLLDIGKSDLLLSAGSKISVYEGAVNNLPDEAAHSTAKKIWELSKNLTGNDVLLVLVSGGGSALLPLPKPPVTIDEMQKLTKLMSSQGADIEQLNIVRKNLEILKGGGLATAAKSAKIITLVMSDVTGDNLGIISSGPTVYDMSTPRMCHDIFKTLGIEEQVPESVITALTNAEALKNEGLLADTRSSFSHVQNVIVGSNSLATQAASEAALTLGYVPFVLSTELEGEANEVGSMFAVLAKYIMLSFGRHSSEGEHQSRTSLEFELIDAGLSKHTLNKVIQAITDAYNSDTGVCIIAGGETTVHVKGSGIGGRNQEMVVSCGMKINEIIEDGIREVFTVEFLSGGTDGQDGPSPAAGGIIDIEFVNECEKSGVDPVSYMENNDTYNLLLKVKPGKYLVNTGFTGTNVMDIQLLIVKQS